MRSSHSKNGKKGKNYSLVLLIEGLFKRKGSKQEKKNCILEFHKRPYVQFSEEIRQKESLTYTYCCTKKKRQNNNQKENMHIELKHMTRILNFLKIKKLRLLSFFFCCIFFFLNPKYI